MSAHESLAAARTVPKRVLAALLVLLVAAAAVALLGSPRADRAEAGEGAHTPVLGDSGKSYRPGSLPDELDAPVAVAVEVMPLALGYDYRSLGKGLDKATALMTDDFGDEFRDTFAKSAARLARSKQAVTSATVRAAGLVDADADRATCLVYVDQALVSSATLKHPDTPVQVAQTRVRVTLRHVGDRWLVDGIEPF